MLLKTTCLPALVGQRSEGCPRFLLLLLLLEALYLLVLAPDLAITRSEFSSLTFLLPISVLQLVAN
jgi:hypothetical protein